MASLITIRLYNDDGTPKTGANPKLSAIREKDGVKVLESVDMIEVSDGFYKYNFANYKKSELYFFFIDGEQYDDVNKLDSYGNKDTRGRFNSIIIDEDKLAKNIWNIKEKDVNKGTIAEHIFNLKNTSLEDLNIKVDDLFNSLFKKSDELGLTIKGAIAGIKIPEQINDKLLIKNIENLLKTSLDSYYDNTSKGLDELGKSLAYSISAIEKFDDSSIKKEIKDLLDDIESLGLKIDNLKMPEIKDNYLFENNINNGIDYINSELKEINRKMTIAFSRLNKQ